MIERFAENPLITPDQVAPTSPELEVWRVFNAGATVVDGKTVLLMRVAERPIPEPGTMSTVFMDPDRPGEYRTMRVREDDPDLDVFDPRGVFRYKGHPYLFCISHLRTAVSEDGRHFDVSDTPAMLPEEDYECYGLEDPRIVFLDGWYYVNYSAIAPAGITTALARTQDFISFERLGIIFAPDNKDVTIFPEKVGGRYGCLHRPSIADFCEPSIWWAASDDLVSWGDHRLVMAPREDAWDSGRVGCGAYPIRTPEGWLEIYHGADPDFRYCLGAALLDLEEPWRVLARSREPIMEPGAPYEMEGFFPNVIFQNGLVELDDGTVDLYYGGADTTVCGARMNVDAVLAMLASEG